MVQWAKPLLSKSTSRRGTNSRPSCTTSNPAPNEVLGKAVDDGLSTWVLATYVGDVVEASDFGLTLPWLLQPFEE